MANGSSPLWGTLLHFPGDPPVSQAARNIPPSLVDIPFALTGIIWMVIYFLSIRRGFQDKRPAMPALAVGSNIAWEFTYAIVFPVQAVLQVISLLWVMIDAVLLYQAFRYGRKDFPGFSPRAYAATMTGWLIFTFSFLIISSYEFKDTTGGYSTFFVVPFMQLMYVLTLRTRRSTVGQSMYIAVLKLIGDIPGFIPLIAWFPHRYLYILMFVTEIVLDVLYLVLLRRQYAAEGRPLWRATPPIRREAVHEPA